MTERERLMELLRETFEYTRGVCIEFDEAVEINADYLLANGVIVPPCKVGDIVYADGWFWMDGKDIVAYQITNIVITQNKKGEWTKKYRAMRLEDGQTIDIQLNFSFDDLGKTVFLTKKEYDECPDSLWCEDCKYFKNADMGGEGECDIDNHDTWYGCPICEKYEKKAVIPNDR